MKKFLRAILYGLLAVGLLGAAIYSVTYIQSLIPIPTDTSSDTATDTSSDTSTDSSSDTSIQSLTELVTNHTYEVEITTNETKLLELESIINNVDYNLAIKSKEGASTAYIGFKGNISNNIDNLLYLSNNKEYLNDYDADDSQIKQFIYEEEYEINLGTYNIFDYLTITDITEEEPTYTRVEVERYEIVFPGEVNGDLVYGGYQIGDYSAENSNLALCMFTFDDSLATYSLEDSFAVSFYVYTNYSSMSFETVHSYHVEQGDYGRYVISETQVADEPVVFTFEPIYDYVLIA